jgi:hypothetical protein
MADLSSEIMRILGVKMPKAPAEGVSPEQRQLHEELTKREMAKQGPVKRAVAGAVEGIPQFIKGLTSDPNMPRQEFDKTSGFGKAGMAASVLPFGPKGIKGLYSRVERIAESLPDKVHPNKLGTILRNRANQEEVSWRGIDKLMQDAGDKPIAKADVVSRLQEKPLDVKVIRKGDTGDWSKAFEDKLNALDRLGHQRTPEQDADYQRLIDMENRHSDPGGRPNTTQYDSYQMPGASNYREDLIQLAEQPGQKIKTFKDGAFDDGNGIQHASVEHISDRPVFTSHHWEEPNVLVHVRHNERQLPTPNDPDPKEAFTKALADTGSPPELLTFLENGMRKVGKEPKFPAFPQGPKGRMLENIQSDWHQRGAHQGYRANQASPVEVNQPELVEAERRLQNRIEAIGRQLGLPADDYSTHEVVDAASDLENLLTFRINNPVDANGAELVQEEYQRLHDLHQEVREARMAYDNTQDAYYRKSNTGVPDAPFKDSWAELALKQQLLDVAERPDLNWIGIAPSSELRSRGEVISPEFQDKQLPRTLEKLLKPFGGKVEKADLGIKSKTAEPYWDGSVGNYGGFRGEGYVGNQPQEIFSILPTPENTRQEPQDMINELRTVLKNQQPDIQAFIARLTPEMKQQIKEKGFPMLLALLYANQGEQ